MFFKRLDSVKPPKSETKAPDDDLFGEALSRFRDLANVKKAVKPDTNKERDAAKDAALRSSSAENERAKQELINDRIREELKDQISNREMRFKYSKWVFAYLVSYSIFVGLLLWLSGFEEVTKFSLEPEVLKYLVGSTAVSAIGLVAAVVTGLFNSGPKKGS